MKGFWRKAKPPPGPALDEQGRPILIRWSPEHLQRLLAERDNFQVMTVDGLYWIDPFSKTLVPAAFDWQKEAEAWLLEHRPWRQQEKPLRRERLYVERWAHFLRENIADTPHLRYFLRDGRWLNPLNGKWVAQVRQAQQAEMIQKMAESLAQAELASGSSKLLDELRLKQLADAGARSLSQAQMAAQPRHRSPSPNPAPATAPSPRSAMPIVPQQPSQSSQQATRYGLSPGQAAELEQAGYAIGPCLGRGGMAVVFRATQISLQRQVALKVLHLQGDQPQRFAQRFLSEARVAARMSHPNVVTIYDVGQISGLVYIAMEYMSGGDLEQQLQRIGRFHQQEALRCLCDILRGLAAIHDHGVIHRDVKTANCFIAADGRISVGDLGIARDTETEEHLTNPRAVVGTPAFMPPEQSIPGAEVDVRGDVYAAGVIAFHLLSGAVPFDGENALVVLRRIISEPSPDLRDVVTGMDPRIAALVARLMHKERDQRPPTALQALLETEQLLQQITA